MRPALVLWLLRHGLLPFLAPDYVVLVGLAGLLGAAASLRLARRDGAAVHLEARALSAGYVAALAGGYVFEGLRAIPEALAAGAWAPILGAGRAAYGGLLAGIVAAVLVHRRARQPIAPLLDRLTPLLGVTFALVRLGCFLAGCDYGRPTSGVLGVRFPTGSPAALDHAALGWVRAGAPSLPVHPTELYEAALGLAATAVAWLWLRRGIRDGRAFAAWIAVYAAGRFGIELLRGDASRGLYAGLSTAQYVSLALLAAVGAWARSRRAPAGLRREGTHLAAAGMLLVAIFGSEEALPQTAPKPKPPQRGPAPAASASRVGVGVRLGASSCAGAAARGAAPYPYPYPYPPYPYPYPYPYAPAPYPYPPAPYPVPAPPPAAATPARPPAPEEPPPPPRHVTLRAAFGPGLPMGNPAVPVGGFADVLAAYRFAITPTIRFELGLEGRVFRNVEATHVTLGLPLGFAFGVSRHVEITTALAFGHTWFLFDSPFFNTTNAWGARYELGLQFLVGSRVLLGTAPLGFNLQASQSIGVLTMWEPRVWVGVGL